ncbi:hypothetical protein LTR08_004439 [Meristemomyces frigidus]|nr:hypothetical protein LTR08_004439 [Meristemomyces frigidus]
MYTFSAAVLVQALVLISFSPVADYGTYRKHLLMLFAFSGAIATAAFLLVWPQAYLLGSVLVVMGVVCLGSSFVFLNSFLPLLAVNHPKAKDEDLAGTGPEHSRKTLRDDAGTSAELTLSTQIPSKGVGLGYTVAVFVQILSIGLLTVLKKAHFSSDSTSLRFVLFMVGICWVVLTVPGALWLRNRPGPPLRTIARPSSRLPAPVQYLTFAWSSVWKTVKTAAKLRQTWVFLIA